MVQYAIKGGKPLSGEITISGAKNAALAIIPATVLCNGICRIENIPKISDVTTMLELLRQTGAQVRLLRDATIEIDARESSSVTPDYEKARRIRASYYLLGAMLGRFHQGCVPIPGGCDLGVRPIDQHIKGFQAMGASVDLDSGHIRAASGERLKAGHIYLDMASVGATINIMLAAVLAEGTTVLENAAKEPHVVDLANFLNAMGADVKGAGTDVIKIHGRDELGGGSYAIIPDQIEAGTFMTAVAAAGGDVVIRNVIPKHLDCISAKLIEMGVEIEEYDDAVRVICHKHPLRKTTLKTSPYPGFPTDMQPQMAVCLSLADGTSTINESVSDARFRYVDELKRMGAHITVDGKMAVVESVSRFSGAPVKACDLRAGAALVIAALAARGETIVDDVYYIERGYEDMVEKLQAVGADIQRRILPDPPMLRVMNN